MIDIAIFNGPNLASLGIREPMIYGNTSAVELKRSSFYGAQKKDFVLLSSNLIWKDSWLRL